MLLSGHSDHTKKVVEFSLAFVVRSTFNESRLPVDGQWVGVVAGEW